MIILINFHRLEELFLNNNQISIVPHSICRLGYLHTLSMSDNSLEALGSDIGMRYISSIKL
jgi:Leucine-rich repeat (LRR) protein